MEFIRPVLINPDADAQKAYQAILTDVFIASAKIAAPAAPISFFETSSEVIEMLTRSRSAWANSNAPVKWRRNVTHGNVIDLQCIALNQLAPLAPIF